MARVVNVNFRMDEDLKQSMEQVCNDMGLTMTAAFTIFAKKVSREKRIPFEVSADPFYSESYIRYLEQKSREAGLAIVPIGIYFSTNGLVKLEIALARGKKLHDKRQAMAERDSKREIARALKMRSR